MGKWSGKLNLMNNFFYYEYAPLLELHQLTKSWFYTNKKKLKKNFMAPFYGWVSFISRLQIHFEETVYFNIVRRGVQSPTWKKSPT